MQAVRKFEEEKAQHSLSDRAGEMRPGRPSGFLSLVVKYAYHGAIRYGRRLQHGSSDIHAVHEDAQLAGCSSYNIMTIQ